MCRLQYFCLFYISFFVNIQSKINFFTFYKVVLFSFFSLYFVNLFPSLSRTPYFADSKYCTVLYQPRLENHVRKNQIYLNCFRKYFQHYIIVGIIKVFRSNKSLQKYFSSFEAALAGMQVSNQQISNT